MVALIILHIFRENKQFIARSWAHSEMAIADLFTVLETCTRIV
jgi:hypothetical protein